MKSKEDRTKSKAHWEHVYSTKSPERVSWFQEHAEQSLRMIQDTGIPLSASIIDVGGGASTLADDLLQRGYTDITVLDISQAALHSAQTRLGAKANRIHWLEADILKATFPVHAYDVWHDRAVFHFLTEPEQRQQYVQQVLHAVKPGGHVIIATFAEDGPIQCSGLPVMRYNKDELHAEFGHDFTLLHHEKEEHQTPFDTTQKFLYCYCRLAFTV